MKIVQIKQNKYNPNLIGGFEKMGISMYPQTEVTLEPPMRNGKLHLDVDESGKKRIMKFVGADMWDSKDTIDRLFQYIPAIPDWGLTLNLDSDKDFLSYILAKSCKGLIAKDIKEAKNPMSNYAFYFYEEQAEITNKVKDLETYAEAVGVVSTLKKENPEHLIYLAKYILNDFSIQDTLVAFDRIMSLLSGEVIKENPVKVFMDAAKESEDKIRIATDVREALSKSIIKKSGLNYFNPISTTKYGSTPNEVIEFFLDELNRDELGEGTKKDKAHTIRYQLKNFIKNK